MISIIVPVYNVETYLPTCIESILDQTYKDFEILLIDDGSTDNSGNICDEYSKRDNRCIAIHQQNKGVYNARNTGLSHATGEYISFVDSDDYIHPQMLEILYKALQKGDYDFAMVTHKKVFNKLGIIDISGACINTITLNRDTLISGLYNKTHISESDFQAVWNKLYKKHSLKICYSNQQAVKIQNLIIESILRPNLQFLLIYHYITGYKDQIQYHINLKTL